MAWLLLPVSMLFAGVVLIRRTLFKAGILKVNKFSVPVVIIGNISVGGTGKTPIVSAVVKRCQSAGIKPAIVSRGYGAAPANHPRQVEPNTPVELSGDEPLLLARETGVPVCICAERSAAVNWLIENNDVDVIISDDGMQHYAMHRDAELAVVDGQRKLGNGWLLPAGPLRESRKRLQQVNVVAVHQAKNVTEADKRSVLAALNLSSRVSASPSTASKSNPLINNIPLLGHFCLDIVKVQNLADQSCIALETLRTQRVHAVAGLGNPSRYFDSLRAAGLDVIEHAMPDHHRYTANDISFDDQFPILITSKDAVKIRALDVDVTRVFEVSVSANLDPALNQAIDQMIAALIRKPV